MWTGGWDSTFRLLILALNGNVCVQPYYIIDEGRGSLPLELEAMEKIRGMIYERIRGSRDRIYDTLYFNRKDIAPNACIQEKYRCFSNKKPIGTQYEWMAEFACMKRLDALETGIIGMDGNIKYVLEDCVRVEDPDIGVYYKLPDNYSESSTISIFKPFHFPLHKLSKAKLADIARKNGTIDILMQSWFCFTPIKGEPCGVCNPCNIAIKEGMSFRMPEKAIWRNNYRYAYIFLRKIRNYVKRKMNYNK